MINELLETGEVVATHGIHGELKVYPWADSPDFLKHFKRFRIEGHDYSVISSRVHGNCVLLRLEGIDTPEAAEQLRGKKILFYREDYTPKKGWYIADLIGLNVRSDGKSVGILSDVIQMPGNDVWVVKGSREYLIPSVPEFVKEVNLDLGYAEVVLIKGMAADEN